ncbi:MAG: hypothetical protein ACERKN_11945 [Velocimicrobium sp.]
MLETVKNQRDSLSKSRNRTKNIYCSTRNYIMFYILLLIPIDYNIPTTAALEQSTDGRENANYTGEGDITNGLAEVTNKPNYLFRRKGERLI